jgi:hypothetical protein
MNIPEPPESYWNAYLPRLRERIEQDRTRRNRTWQWLLARPAAMLATLAFLLLAILMVRTPSPGAGRMETLNEAAIEALLRMTEPLDPAPEPIGLCLNAGSLQGLMAELEREPDWGPLPDSESDPFSFLDLSQAWGVGESGGEQAPDFEPRDS